ncbi:hypothetical protein BGZ67_006162 [Mortierella alpina]|nr:hypothetical protein BGZ67_006162 [Mortierella alpina]
METSASVRPRPRPTATSVPARRTPTTAPTRANPTRANPTLSSTLSSGTLSPTPSSEPDSAQAGLSTPAIAGIGAAVGLILLFIISVFLCKRRRASVYAKRPDGYDPSRDPIDPNDVLPPDNKPSQRTPTALESDSGFNAHPMATRGAEPSTNSPYPSAPSTQQPQQDYEHYEDHIQSHFAHQSPELQTPTADALASSVLSSPVRPPPNISTTPSMESNAGPGPLSPSQRAQMNYQQPVSPRSPRSPRSHPLQAPSSNSRPGPDAEIFNEMGNQFVLQGNGIEQGRGSYEQVGARAPSESSYRTGTAAPMQDAQRGNMRGPAPPPSGQYYSNSGSPSPTSLGSPRGPRPGNSNSSAYSSPRQGPSQASPRLPHAQYQGHHPYPQQASHQMPSNGPGHSPHMYPQSQPPYGAPIRSPPMGPGSRGPGYSQPSPNYPPSSNYQPTGNYTYT